MLTISNTITMRILEFVAGKFNVTGNSIGANYVQKLVIDSTVIN